MANSVDIGAIALGACLGYGLRKEIKSAGGVCKAALLATATVAAGAVAAGAEAAAKEPKQPQGQATQSNGQNG